MVNGWWWWLLIVGPKALVGMEVQVKIDQGEWQMQGEWGLQRVKNEKRE